MGRNLPEAAVTLPRAIPQRWRWPWILTGTADYPLHAPHSVEAQGSVFCCALGGEAGGSGRNTIAGFQRLAQQVYLRLDNFKVVMKSLGRIRVPAFHEQFSRQAQGDVLQPGKPLFVVSPLHLSQIRHSYLPFHQGKTLSVSDRQRLF